MEINIPKISKPTIVWPSIDFGEINNKKIFYTKWLHVWFLTFKWSLYIIILFVIGICFFKWISPIIPLYKLFYGGGVIIRSLIIICGVISCFWAIDTSTDKSSNLPYMNWLESWKK